ncbi:MAG: EcsC family protein [Rhodospirillales bacterium]
MNAMTQEDRRALKDAVRLLEHPGFAARLANFVGQPFEKALGSLPEKFSEPVHQSVTLAIQRALEVAVSKMDPQVRRPSTDRKHKLLTFFTGSVGGFFGLPALALELPVTTTVMLRSIAEIARSEGEDISDPGVRLACLEVFALGGRQEGDDSTETGYYAVRAVLARAITDAAKYISERGVAEQGAPVLVRLIAAIATRFGIVVTEKAAAVAVPVIGALGAATINLIFMEHFQNIAHGHFTVRRLERTYGPDVVRAEYERCSEELLEARRIGGQYVRA